MLALRRPAPMSESFVQCAHPGGVHSVAEGVMVSRVIDSLDASSAWRPAGVPNTPCRTGDAWEWDGVKFDMLNPGEASNPDEGRNDNSCVLRVTAGGKRLLIPADIEAPSERALIKRMSADLQADVLIAPHHGSRTSSTPAFLAAVKPSVVVFPVGYRNRYRHPNKDVCRRYTGSGGTLLRTDRDAVVSFTLAGTEAPQRSRVVRRRYWHDAWGWV